MENQIIKASNEGPLQLGETVLSVAVLEDGTRVISHAAIFKAFGRTRRGRPVDEVRAEGRPSFIDAKNLQPLIDAEMDSYLTPIQYQTRDGKEATGYNALILPKLCKVYFDARALTNPETGKPYIDKKQEPLARMSETLLLGLSTVGIIALVDEATGYQYERERDELQKIITLYISEALLPWQRRFPNIYYKEIFRLNGWDFSVSEITRRRPSVVGKWTTQFVYEQLPKGVLEALKEKTPKNDAGQYKAKLHQSLTDDVGHPSLQNQISSIVALMQISDTWDGFKQQFERLKMRRAGQLEMPLASKREAPKRAAGVKKPKTTLFDQEQESTVRQNDDTTGVDHHK